MVERVPHQGEGVRAETQPECLQTDHFASSDVALVYVGSQLLDEVGLELLGRRLEHQSIELHAGVHDLVDNSLPQDAVGVADPSSPTLTSFRDDQRSACLKVLTHVSN